MRVEVDGKPLSGRGERVYLMLNKPVGIVCTADPREKYNVVSYLQLPHPRLSPWAGLTARARACFCSPATARSSTACCAPRAGTSANTKWK